MRSDDTQPEGTKSDKERQKDSIDDVDAGDIYPLKADRSEDRRFVTTVDYRPTDCDPHDNDRQHDHRQHSIMEPYPSLLLNIEKLDSKTL